MILKSITLENYRPYIGPETIEFATGEQNITIIEGKNDSGKTSLLNAFTWCLYGKEFYRNEGKEPIYNKSAMSKLHISDSLIVKVLIKMVDNNNRNVRFIRTQEFSKINTNKTKGYNSTFEIFRYNQLNEEEQVLVTDNYINSHLPEDLRKYFLFDGEQLIQFLNNKNRTSVKNGVYTLSQLDLLNNLENHIKQRKNEINNKIKDINPNLGSNTIKLSTLEESKEKDENKLKENNLNIEKFNKDIDLFDKEIKDFGEDPKKIQETINELTYECDSISNQMKENNTNLTKHLIKNFNSIYSLESFDNFLDISKDLEEKRYIPSPFKKDFLEVLLKEKKCICGTEFTENSECYKELMELFENTDEVTNLSDDVNMLRGRCEKSILKYPPNFQEDLKKYYIENQNLETDLEIKKSLLKAQKLRLDRLNISRINTLQEKIETAKSNIISLTEENGTLKNNINNYYPNEIKKLKSLIMQEENDEKELQILKKKNSFCDEIIKTTKNLREELSKEIHEKLEEITSEEFKNIHWKEAYSKIIIDNNFDISFEKKDGSIINSTDPSSGTQLVLALSFMIALNSLSGFKLPLIIDTPLGRLDNEVRENIADYLPEYIKNKQITFIVTNSEYSGEFKKKIKKYVGKEYRLQYYNDDGEYTKVI